MVSESPHAQKRRLCMRHLRVSRSQVYLFFARLTSGSATSSVRFGKPFERPRGLPYCSDPTQFNILYVYPLSHCHLATDAWNEFYNSVPFFICNLNASSLSSHHLQQTCRTVDFCSDARVVTELATICPAQVDCGAPPEGLRRLASNHKYSLNTICHAPYPCCVCRPSSAFGLRVLSSCCACGIPPNPKKASSYLFAAVARHWIPPGVPSFLYKYTSTGGVLDGSRSWS